MRTLIFLASLTFGSWSIATAQTREPIENSVGMKLVLIPDGQLTMGSPPSEPQADDDERQYLAILSKPFYMGVTEVTQGQYQKVMGTNPSSLKDAQDPERSANMPVEQVSWEDAFEFCRRLARCQRKSNAIAFTDYRPSCSRWRIPLPTQGLQVSRKTGKFSDQSGRRSWV